MFLTVLVLLAVQCHASGIEPGAARPFKVVSDIDDTVKITHVTNKADLLFRTFFHKSTFAGMPELYQELTKTSHANEVALNPAAELVEPKNSVVFLSNGPQFLQTTLTHLFFGVGFEGFQIRLRDWISQSSKIFKNFAMNSLVQETEDPFLMLGDDTERDPEVYEKFRTTHPSERSLSVYIHRVVGPQRAIPEGMIEYYTAFDVALSELQAGRLTEDQVVRVGQVVLAAPEEKLIPGFADCPSSQWMASFVTSKGALIKAGTPLFDTVLDVYRRVEELCSARS